MSNLEAMSRLNSSREDKDTSQFPGSLTLADLAIMLFLVTATTERDKNNTSIITNNLASYLLVSSLDRCDLFRKSPFCCPAELLLTCRCLDHRGRLVEMGAESRTVAAHLHNHCDTSITTSDHCTTEFLLTTHHIY